MSVTIHSFGRSVPAKPAKVVDLFWRHENLPRGPGGLLAYGCGRSYSDVCLNDGGTLLRTRRLDRFICFDEASGHLTCESGVTMKDIVEFAVPRGFFLPVTPGTRFVTIGGAIANDVHGKNHHVAGSFGHHVIRLELLRSTGERLICSRSENPDLFVATLGGLGLTGLITWAEIKLLPVPSPFVEVEYLRFYTLEEYFQINDASYRDWPYTVAWFDCGSQNGRGIYIRGRHAQGPYGRPQRRERTLKVPFVFPISVIRPLTIRAFNFLYFWRPWPKGEQLVHYVPFFYPLDGINDWNLLYGPHGFYQYQCVLPPDNALPALREMLAIIARFGDNSFLGVLKTFGDLPQAGMLSFSRPGTTLALDFANRGERTLKMLSELDSVVKEAGGALNPSKDARMPREMFTRSFSRLNEFVRFVDQGFSSSFWRRVMG